MRSAVLLSGALTLACGIGLAEEGDPKPRSIAFLVLNGTYNTELVAPMDVLQHVVGRVEPAPHVFTVGVTKEPIRTAEGLRVVPDYSIDDAPEIDILVVASTMESRGVDRKNEKLIAWLGATGKKARHVMSLCWGAFLLAEAGLLDGGPATTFPTDYDLLEKDYPEIDVKRNVSFVDGGKALTSAGGVKSYEVAMFLVEKLYGKDVASGIASGLLIGWEPSASR
jgi:transcriptional regulator GlxA family with amidase domain